MKTTEELKQIPTPDPFWGLCTHHFTNEELYNAFKGRLKSEATLNVWGNDADTSRK